MSKLLTAAVRILAETDASCAANAYRSHNAEGEFTVTNAAVVNTIQASLASPTEDAFELSLPKSLSEIALLGEGRAAPMLLGPAMRALMAGESRTDMPACGLAGYVACNRSCSLLASDAVYV
jgi:hypothetical protein